MQTLILFAVFFGTTLLLLGIYVFVNRRRLEAAAALKDRLSTTAAPADISILRDLRKSAVPFLDQLLTGRSYTLLIERAIDRAGMHWTVGEFSIASVLLASMALLAGQQFGLASALISASVGLLLPSLLLYIQRRRRVARLEAQLPEAIDMIVNAMRAGFSFQAAMKFVGEEMPAPVGEEFATFYDEQRLGLDVRDALLDLQERIDTLDIKMFVTSLLLQRETGGNLSELLNTISALIRQRLQMRGQLRTLTAEPKMSAQLLAAMPFVMFAIVYALNPTYMRPMLVSSTGHSMLALSVVLVVVGYAIMSRIADVEM